MAFAAASPTKTADADDAEDVPAVPTSGVCGDETEDALGGAEPLVVLAVAEPLAEPLAVE